jgi:hypothetical protein
MLFLAVFCGFLAEYELEHKIEKDRAKELARSFFDELRDDSLSITLSVKNRLRQETSLKWLMGYFKDSSLNNVSKTFSIHYLYGIHFRTPSVFEPRTVVLEQLKNSRSLRYFRNQKLQKLIGDLSVAILHINDRQAVENNIREQFISPFTIKHYDYAFDSRITKNGTLLFADAIAAYEKSDEIISFHLGHRKHSLLFSSVNKKTVPFITDQLLVGILETGFASFNEKRRAEGVILICKKAMEFLDGLCEK